MKTRERFMGIGQILTMPLFFASNAIYPIAVMPTWLQVTAHVNPLAYEVDALRALMLAGGTSVYGLALDFAVLVGTMTALVSVAARLHIHASRPDGGGGAAGAVIGRAPPAPDTAPFPARAPRRCRA